MASINFLDLPLEIRLNIYKKHFRATTINVKPHGTIHNFTSNPCLPHLSLACRQIYRETKDVFYSCVNFNFPSTLVFVDILSRWQPSRISKIRRVELRMTNLVKYNAWGHRSWPGLPIATLFQVFNTLNLTHLVLHDSGGCYPKFHSITGYKQILALLQVPGWKTLELIYCCGDRISRYNRAIKYLRLKHTFEYNLWSNLETGEPGRLKV